MKAGMDKRMMRPYTTLSLSSSPSAPISLATGSISHQPASAITAPQPMVT